MASHKKAIGEAQPACRPVAGNSIKSLGPILSLEDLKEFYNHLKEKQVPIGGVGDHGLSLGIYFQDPDGNGIEVYYETPRSEWYRQENIFMNEERPKGHFPGPWDEVLLKEQAAAG